MTFFLGDISTVRTGLVTSRKKAKFDSLQHIEYKQISLLQFGNGVKLDKTEKEKDIFVSAEEIDSKYFTQEGDIVVRLRAPSSAIYIEKEDVGLLIHSLLAVIRPNSDKVNGKFLAYYLNTSIIQKIFKQKTKGTAIPMLKTKDLEELPIVLPPLKKQQKIVEFLELADKERRLLQELSDKNQQLSQAVMESIIEKEKENIL